MRVLSFDPGGIRIGVALLETGPSGPSYLKSGVFDNPQDPSWAFQVYRYSYTQLLWEEFNALVANEKPDLMANEVVPAVGSFSGTYMYLANVATTVWHCVAIDHGITAKQIGATSVHKAMTGKGRKVTKPQVRNGVLKLLPELEGRKKDWVKVFEEPDAIAIGLTALGYRNDQDGS